MSDEIKNAIQTLKIAIIEDAGYAIGWHDNLAMACYDAMSTHPNVEDMLPSNIIKAIGDDAARRFMSVLFDINLDIDHIKSMGYHQKSQDTLEV